MLELSFFWATRWLITITTRLHLFNSLFWGTPWVSWHQKGRTILGFNEARYDGVAVASAGPHADHLHLAPNITMPVPALMLLVRQHEGHVAVKASGDVVDGSSQNENFTVGEIEHLDLCDFTWVGAFLQNFHGLLP